jgi:hypothetical protein
MFQRWTLKQVMIRATLLAALILGSVTFGFVMGTDVASAAAQERATLTTPAVSSTTISHYEITGLVLQRGTSAQPTWRFVIWYADNLGNVFSDEHVDAEAATLIKALNKANLSTKSLERRALEHLVAEGKIPAASITGVPQ